MQYSYWLLLVVKVYSCFISTAATLHHPLANQGIRGGGRPRVTDLVPPSGLTADSSWVAK